MIVLDVTFLSKLKSYFSCHAYGRIVAYGNKDPVHGQSWKLLGFIIVKQDFFYIMFSFDLFNFSIK